MLVVMYTCFAPQTHQAFMAVTRNTQHALFIEGVTFRRAVGEHTEQPGPQRRIETRTQHQRRMRAQHPFQRLEWDAGRGPRVARAPRNLAAVGKVCSRPGPRLPVHDRDLVAGTMEVPGAGDTDDPATKNKNFHTKPVFG